MTLRRLRARLRTVVAILGAAPIAALSVAAAPAAAGAAGLTRDIALAGTTTFNPARPGVVTGVEPPEIFGQGIGPDAAQPPALKAVNRQLSGDGQAGDQGGGEERDRSPVLLKSFDGINHRQHRLANGGNQFSLEPPDQGLCVGNGFVMESVNDAMNVYDANGTSLKGVTDL